MHFRLNVDVVFISVKFSLSKFFKMILIQVEVLCIDQTNKCFVKKFP